jgi:hypothetical protein
VKKLNKQIPSDAVNVLHDKSGYYRVVIFKRDNETFGFDEWKFSDEEDSWLLCKKQTETVVSTYEDALREAVDRVAWIKQE